MSALGRDVFARVYADLALAYGSSLYIAHLAADAAEDAMTEARTQRNIRRLKRQQRFRKHELLGLPERPPSD